MLVMNVWFHGVLQADHYPTQEPERCQNLWWQFPLTLNHHTYAGYQGVSASLFHNRELYKLLIADQHIKLLGDAIYISLSSIYISLSSKYISLSSKYTTSCHPTLLPFLAWKLTITSQVIIPALFFSIQNTLKLDANVNIFKWISHHAIQLI